MTPRTITFAAAVCLVLLWMLPGCGDHDHNHNGDSHGSHEHGDHEHGSHDAGAKLSPEDKALADKQKTCPVSGEALGSMGGPIKIMHEGRAVFLCCSGCEKEFRADPEKFLKNLSR